VSALIGVLALQGDFEAHARVLDSLGAEPRLVRTVADLEQLDGLIIPGGESTTMTLGIEREGMAQPLRELIGGGCPTLGTCAGLIMLDREHLDLMDMRAERNAFGRQVKSFESDIDLHGLGEGFHGVFIRAPWVAEHGSGVDVLAEVDGHPVAVAAGNMLAVAFHPEIDGDTRLHEWLLGRVQSNDKRGQQ
jgi:5'-phosphate synthase pdxT subunit